MANAIVSKPIVIFGMILLQFVLQLSSDPTGSGLSIVEVNFK